MKKRKRWFIVAGSVIVLLLIGYNINLEYAYVPDDSDLLNDSRVSFTGYDLWGQTIPAKEAENMIHSNINSHELSAQHGAIPVDEDFIEFGRNQFYTETFNNEEYLTDILGILDGGITLPKMVKAIIQQKLTGEPTDNLQVELAKDVTIGGKTYQKNETIDTGLDLPKRALTPLGMPISYSRGEVRTGVSCASCHATVDTNSGKVVEGAPNLNLNAGMLLALAPNSTAFLPNTEVDYIKAYINDPDRSVSTSTGEYEPLPNPEMLEVDIDNTLASWPKGFFDSTIDFESNPAQIPDSYTLEDHPYGWNEFATVGPFKGLSTLNNNVHAQNSDLLSQFEQSNALFDIDKEVYIGTILQNAANPNYRFNPYQGKKPSDFFASIDDSPEVPGVNEMVKPPSFPNISLFSPNGSIVSSPGFRVAEQINAMSAFQNALRPPLKAEVDSTNIEQGREVFNRAGCTSCHAGKGYTNHQVIPVEEIKTEPSRAKSFRDAIKIIDESWIYSPGTPVPVPAGAKQLKVPTNQIS